MKLLQVHISDQTPSFNTYWFKNANRYRITITTGRGKPCKNARMPATNSGFDSNSIVRKNRLVTSHQSIIVAEGIRFFQPTIHRLF